MDGRWRLDGVLEVLTEASSDMVDEGGAVRESLGNWWQRV